MQTASKSGRDLCRDTIEAGYTPIFEYTSPENRVVLAYDKPELTLLAVRQMRTGAYMPHRDVAKLAESYGVALVSASDPVSDYASFWSEAKALEGVEGFVIAFEDGHRVKIKADSYALRHKALAGLTHEKNLLAWVSTGATDDVLPLLSPDTGKLVLEYQDKVFAGVNRWEAEIGRFLDEHGHLPGKEFALIAKEHLDPKLQSVAFRALDGTPAGVGLMEVLKKASMSDTKVDTVRELFGLEWEPFDPVE